jgi:quinol monooxygenase YgiN
MITFIVHARVKPENAPAFEALMTHVAAMTHEHEPGVRYYEFAKSVEQPDTYVMVEAYQNRQVHAAHMASRWVIEAIPKSLGLMEGKPDIKQYVSRGCEPISQTRF